MSLADCGAFGGTLKIGNREYIVRGRTYRKIAEQINWWISECFCPVIELRLLLSSYPDIGTEGFILAWLKASRTAMFSESELQARVLSTFSARRFDIWQSCRDDGLRLEDLDFFLDELDGPRLQEFFEEADKKMALANGVSELEYLANCFSRPPSSPGRGGSVDAMLSQACVHSKNRIQIHELLDCTPAAIRTLFQEPESINANAVLDAPVHPNDKIGQKRVTKVLSDAAKNIIEGKRIDAYREPAEKPKKERVQKPLGPQAKKKD